MTVVSNFPPHALFEFGGTLETAASTPNEIWSCGIRVVSFNNQGALTESTVEGFLDALVGGQHGIIQTIGAWYSSPASQMAVTSVLKWVKLNNISPNGKYTNPGTTHRRDVNVAGNFSAQLPSFLSLAMTWETAKTRGRAHRGRIYPPNYTYSCTGAKISTANRDANATAGQNLIKLVNNAHCDDAGTDRLEAVIASRIDGSFNPITGVTSDDIFDVQRRRKNAAVPLRSAIKTV